MAQIQVQLEGGETVKVDGDAWFVGDHGLLDVVSKRGEEPTRTVASFAHGQWVSVKAEEQQGGMSVGDLTVNIKVEAESDNALAKRAADQLERMCNQARAEQADDSGKADSQMFLSVEDVQAYIRLLRRVADLEDGAS